MLDLADIKPADVLIDLGSGDGRIVIAACKRFGIRATGVEIDPSLVRQSETLARQEGLAGIATFVQADLFGYDLRPASVVTMFLTPGVNLRLRSKLLRELRPGTRIVSHRFDMGSWTPTKTVQLADDRIFLWVVPANGLGASGAASAHAEPAAENPDLLALLAGWGVTVNKDLVLEARRVPPRGAAAGTRVAANCVVAYRCAARETGGLAAQFQFAERQ